jgi:glycine oxidase
VKVIIIGAGAAGLGIGWRLAQKGAGVTVLERAQPGRGATWAAAGLIAAAHRRTGSETPEAELARLAATLWPRFSEEIEQASGRTITFRKIGKLDLALTAAEQCVLAADARAGAGEMLSSDGARAIEPRIRPDILGALWNANEAKVDNRALGPALAAAFMNEGGSLLVNETAVRFEFHDDRILGVRTPFALHQADAYVLAAGAWTSRIEGLPDEAVPPVIPAKGEMLALTAPAPDELPKIAIGGDDIYMVTQRNTLLVGATVQRIGYDSSLTNEAADLLFGRATSIIPSVAGWPVAEHWAGLRPGSPDDYPILGKTSVDRLFAASGQFRSGILYTPAIADALSALVLGLDAPLDLSAFDPLRFAGGAHAES